MEFLWNLVINFRIIIWLKIKVKNFGEEGYVYEVFFLDYNNKVVVF